MDSKKKVIACELVRSSSSARSNAILFLILIAVTTLSLFIFSPTVKAIENYQKMTENQAQTIIDYISNDTSWTTYRINSNDYVSSSELIEKLSLQNSQELADIFNLSIANYSGDIDLNWNNINLIIAKGNNSNNSHCFTYSFIISNYDINEENNLDFIRYQQAPAFTRFFNTQVFENRKCYYFQIRFEWQDNIGDFFVEKELQELTLNNSIRIYPKQNPTISNNNVSFVSLLNLGSINNPIFHTQQLNGYYLNIKNLELQNQKSYIEDNTSGDNGYYFINDGVLTVDYNNWRTQNLKQNFFIGKNLNMVNTYYYYNESGERINANELIFLNYLDYPASGEKTGKWYFPQTSWVRYRDYYPYNIYQALNVQFVSGDDILEEKTVVDNLLVINWSDSSISGDIIGTTTGTITNSSGEIIGNYSGEENFGNLGQKEENEIENALEIDIPIEDPTGDFFTWFFEQLKNCFTINTDQYLNFTILDNEFTINSDDYILNIPVLRDVLGIGMGIFILYGIFKDIRGEIEKIKEGKFEQVGKEDISANML